MTHYRDLPAAWAWAAMAGMNATATEPGRTPITTAVAVRATSMSATILAVARDTRVISLRAESGEQFEFTAGEDVRDFDQLRAGDRVLAHHVRSVSLAPEHGGGELPAAARQQRRPRPSPVAGPAGSIGRQVTVHANVVAVNARERLVTLLGPNGNALVLEIPDRAQLARMHGGDRVRATYTETFALQVRPPPHEGAGR
jgi:hypothetical protein